MTEGEPVVISSLTTHEPFDHAAYAAVPEEWLARFRSSRVFQPAQPGPEVVPL